MNSKRLFLSECGKLVLASALLPISTIACAARTGARSPEEFGARADGRTDDTAALQSCLDAAGPNGVVQLRQGAVYRVNTNHRPSWSDFGGLKLHPGQTLDMNGATLRALPTSVGRGCVVQAFGVNGWRIQGPGKILGEKTIHPGSGGEWGMGIAVFSSADWQIAGGLDVGDCWGDGIYISAQGRSGRPSSNFVIEDVRVSTCRRNGISIVTAANGQIRRFEISDISGTNPQGGIDLEPDDPRNPNSNIRISDGRIRRVQVGVYVVGANRGVSISGMDIEAENSGILIGDNATDISIVDNPSIANRIGGAEGGAIRTVARDPKSIRRLHIMRNTLRGGGAFVIDIFDMGYVDLRVSQNRLHASNRGVQGVARLGTGTFTDNIGVIESTAGKNGEFFVLFDGVRYGGNSYRNLSRNQMYKLVRNGSTEIGREAYAGPLRP